MVLVLESPGDPPPGHPGAAEVRRLGPGDARSLAGLGSETDWIASTWGGPEGLAASGTGWGAFSERRLVAVSCPFFVGAAFEDLGVATEPGFRGLGLSTACAAAVCEDVRRRGRVQSWTTSPDTRPACGWPPSSASGCSAATGCWSPTSRSPSRPGRPLSPEAGRTGPVGLGEEQVARDLELAGHEQLHAVGSAGDQAQEVAKAHADRDPRALGPAPLDLAAAVGDAHGVLVGAVGGAELVLDDRLLAGRLLRVERVRHAGEDLVEDAVDATLLLLDGADELVVRLLLDGGLQRREVRGVDLAHTAGPPCSAAAVSLDGRVPRSLRERTRCPQAGRGWAYSWWACFRVGGSR